MSSMAVPVALVASLMVMVPSAWGATLTAFIDPQDNEATFKLSYLQTFTIRHDSQGELAGLLEGQEWVIDEKFSSGNPGVTELAERINSGILDNRSTVRVSDLEIAYKASLVEREKSSDINYNLLISGALVDFVIKEEDPRNPGIIDMGWRHFDIAGPIVVDGIDVNTPIAAIEDNSPGVYAAIEGSVAGDLLSESLMQAEGFSDPLDVWHFLVDPTGISIDANQFGLSEDIAGKVISKYTLGESSIREGRKTDELINMPFTLDREYYIRTINTIDIAETAVVGYTSISSLDDLETLGFSFSDPIGTTTATGAFPVFIVYGMAAMAAVGAGMFFFISSRQLKKEKGATQTGIDPSNLQASATSTAAGGYQTNRGESQLRSDYDSGSSSSPELTEPDTTRGSMPKGWEKK